MDQSLVYNHHPLNNNINNNNYNNSSVSVNVNYVNDNNNYVDVINSYGHNYYDINDNNNNNNVAELGFLGRLPPGFRFHPTDEELVGFYLQKKMEDSSFIAPGFVIREADFNAEEPWQLVMNNTHYSNSSHLNDIILCENEAEQRQQQEQQSEGTCMYFYSKRGSKYSTGTRANRATPRGYWKATGKDRPITSHISAGCDGSFRETFHASPPHWRVLGIKKTLVFYFGRAPHGLKTNWIMHEYAKVDAHHSPASSQVNGWVLCRIFFKNARGKLGIPSLLEELNPIPDKLPPLDLEVEALSIPSPTKRMFSMSSSSQPMETIPIGLTPTSLSTNISFQQSQETNMHHFVSDYNYTQARCINENQTLYIYNHKPPKKGHENNDCQMFLEP